MEQRGGQILKSGKVGRVNCLRQTMLRPGETVKPRISGTVKMESLRERDSLRMNAHLFMFLTPIRWLWSSWPDFIKEGPNTALYPPSSSVADPVHVGIGGNPTMTIFDWYTDNYLRVYNEWFKWPEAADATSVDADGNKAVPLPSAFSRVRDSADPDNAGDAQVSSATNFDVRTLAQQQAIFARAMDSEVLSFERYQALLSSMFGADGSREVDQVPILIDDVETGVDPREMPATDGASLGTWQSIYDFDIDHTFGNITAPEHSILSVFLVVRFASVHEDDTDPLAAAVGTPDWAELVGDPRILKATPPQQVTNRELFGTNLAGALGYLPAGWRWRTGVNLVGPRVDARNSFPIYPDSPTTAAACRDASRVNPAFNSAALGDYMVDTWMSIPSYCDTPEAIESYMLGRSSSRKNDKREFITPGVK
jgi:hypothetical protein